MEGVASAGVFAASDGAMRQATFVDLRQAGEWAQYLLSIGWRVERVPDYLYIRRLPLLPIAIAKLQRPREPVDWEKLNLACRKHHVIRLYYETNLTNYELPIRPAQGRRIKNYGFEEELTRRGFSPTKTSYLPRKTIWLDLAKTERQLLAAMKAKTRYNIGLARRRGVKIKVIDGNTLVRLVLKGSALKEAFYTLLQQNAWRLGIFAMPRRWYEAQLAAFGEKCFATLAYPSTGSGQASTLLAGNFFMTSGNACFYSHNGSTALGRKLMAPTLCAWEGIQEARRRKLKIFDFDGIDDGSRKLKQWKGFSRFKKGFGGSEITFPHQHAVWQWPVS